MLASLAYNVADLNATFCGYTRIIHFDDNQTGRLLVEIKTLTQGFRNRGNANTEIINLIRRD